MKVLLGSLFIISIASWTMMISEIEHVYWSGELNYKDLTFEFLRNSLWDSNYTSFYASHLNDGSFTEIGLRKYTSFNIWAIRALLQYSREKNDSSYFDNYGLKVLNFMYNYLQNKTNEGFYHWVYRDGSLPNKSIWDFNDSVLQVGTYQAWVLLGLADIYDYTHNYTYIETLGFPVANFLITKLWDSVNGGFYSVYLPYYEIIPDYSKYSWYQAWPALALMRFYEISNNATYMSYANRTLNFLINYLWEKNLKGFVFQCAENGTADSTTEITLTDQAGCILALAEATKITWNETYWDDYIVPNLNFTAYYLWSKQYNQYCASVNRNGTNPDLTNRPSDLSIWLVALASVIDSLGENDPLKDSLITATTNLKELGWDYEKMGFFRKFYLNGTIADTNKWTIEQAIPLYYFCKYSSEHSMQFTWIYISLGFFIGSLIAIALLNLFIPRKMMITRNKIS